MVCQFVHVVITRFNVKVDLDTDKRIDQEWLRRRFTLFEEFCYPSMAAQHAPYIWMVLFDAETPDEFMRRIESYRRLPSFLPIFVHGVLNDEMIAKLVMASIPPDKDYLITTRLDNDDGMESMFISRIQRTFRETEAEFINFPLGYQWQAGRLYYVFDPSNPFISLVERLPTASEGQSPRTVHCAPHSRLRSVAPVRQILTRPMWLQVLHGTNVSNHLRGVRRPHGGMPKWFVFGTGVVLLHDQWWQRYADVAFTSTYQLAKWCARRVRRVSRVAHKRFPI